MTQRLGRGIALLFHDRGTRTGLVVSSTARPHFTPGKDPVPNLQEAGWAPGPVWTGGISRPHRDSIPVGIDDDDDGDGDDRSKRIKYGHSLLAPLYRLHR